MKRSLGSIVVAEFVFSTWGLIEEFLLVFLLLLFLLKICFSLALVFWLWRLVVSHLSRIDGVIIFVEDFDVVLVVFIVVLKSW